MSEKNHESTGAASTSDSKEKTSKLSLEILRLMREGGEEGRKKAQALMQEALLASLVDRVRPR